MDHRSFENEKREGRGGCGFVFKVARERERAGFVSYSMFNGGVYVCVAKVRIRSLNSITVEEP